VPEAHRESRLFALIRSAVIAALFVSLWLWLIPAWFARSSGGSLKAQQPLGAVLMALGGAIMIRCVFDFAWTGRGTPAPFDPPRHLVITGLYRWVRNPMYIGMGTCLVGEAILFPLIRVRMLILVGILWVFATGFVLVYEEPHLRRTFGAEFEEYRRSVRRWLPRASPYDPRPPRQSEDTDESPRNV
jgi:protein-S-isoprenylcysteine O-methyltransferase Ste14